MNQHQLNQVIEETHADEHETDPLHCTDDVNADILNEMTHKISMKLHKNMTKMHSIKKQSPNQLIGPSSFDEPDQNQEQNRKSRNPRNQFYPKS